MVSKPHKIDGGLAIISVLIGVVCLTYWYFLDKPLLVIINAILLFSSFLFFRQMYEFKNMDNKKWAVFSLCFIGSMFLLAGVVDIILTDFGIKLSKYGKALSDIALLLVCSLTCLYQADSSKYIQFNIRATPIIIISVCIIISQILIIDNASLLLTFPYDHANANISTTQLSIYFSILWCAITAINIIAGRLVDNNCLAVALMSIISLSLIVESISFSILIYFAYCVVLSAVARFSNNYSYMLLGGILFNLTLVARITYKGLLVIPNG